MPGLLGELAPGDLAIWCADHGVDPTTASTDHSREYAPLLAYGLRGGRYDGLFEDVGATAYQRLTGREPPLAGIGHPVTPAVPSVAASASTRETARRVTARLPHGDLAVVFGSGLALVPEGAEVIDEIDYADLGWPATSSPATPTACCSSRWAPDGRAARRVLLACGRPHLYEGWSAAELARPVDDLADAGVRGAAAHQRRRRPRSDARGGHGGGRHAGRRPAERARRRAAGAVRRPAPPGRCGWPPPWRPVCRRARGATSPWPGPQYETPAEAAWLRAYGDVVGMSTAAEVRAAGRSGLPVCVLSLVANAAGAALDHAGVLAAGAAARRQGSEAWPGGARRGLHGGGLARRRPAEARGTGDGPA